MSDITSIGKGVQEGVHLGIGIGRFINGVLALLYTPVALTTQVLFRRDFGERYFTNVRAIIAAGLIGAATFISATMPILTPRLRGLIPYEYFTTPAKPWVVWSAGGLWLLVFLLTWYEERSRLRDRYEAGELWHSRCTGVLRDDGLLSSGTQFVASVLMLLVAVVLRLDLLLALLLCSLVSSSLMDAALKKRAWNAVLDSLDARIESEHLANAIDKRLAPEKLEGLQLPLPAYVAPAARSRIAEVLGNAPNPRRERAKYAKAAAVLEVKPDGVAEGVAGDVESAGKAD